MILTAFIICVLPACILLVLLTTLIPILPAAIASYERIERIAELDERRSATQALREARLAKEYNAVVLQELRIEGEKLKQLQIKQKLGLTSQEFTPQNYD